MSQEENQQIIQEEVQQNVIVQSEEKPNIESAQEKIQEEVQQNVVVQVEEQLNIQPAQEQIQEEVPQNAPQTQIQEEQIVPQPVQQVIQETVERVEHIIEQEIEQNKIQQSPQKNIIEQEPVQQQQVPQKVEQEVDIGSKIEEYIQKLVNPQIQQLKQTILDMDLKMQQQDRTILLQDKLITDLAFELKKTSMQSDMISKIIMKQVQDNIEEQNKVEAEQRAKIEKHIVNHEKKISYKAEVETKPQEFTNSFVGKELSLSSTQQSSSEKQVEETPQERPLTAEEIRQKRLGLYKESGGLTKKVSNESQVEKFMKERQNLEYERTKKRLEESGLGNRSLPDFTYKN